MKRRAFLQAISAAMAATAAPAVVASTSEPLAVDVQVIELATMRDAREFLLFSEIDGQVYRKTGRMSGAAQKVLTKHGYTREMAYQVARKAEELRLDVEHVTGRHAVLSFV